MSRWATYCQKIVVCGAALLLLSIPQLAAAAPGDPLVDYGADLVSDYVFRGTDVFQSEWQKKQKTPSAFNTAPALQPYVTLHGPAGLSFGLWGSLALADRKADEATNFAGLSELDEIDYTLSWGWSNKAGAFSAGLVSYTNPPHGGTFASEEMFVTYAPPILASASPVISHYVVPTGYGTVPGGASYTSLGFSGGSTVTWKISFGRTDHFNDVTAGVGYPIGPIAISLNVADRPNQTQADKDAGYKAAIFWLDINYSGSVKE
jgi:hypothetical protein